MRKLLLVAAVLAVSAAASSSPSALAAWQNQPASVKWATPEADVVNLPPAVAAAFHPEGAVAVCNWANFTQYGHDGYNWVWVRCNHTLHGHGYGYHPRRQLKAEARAFRAYCGID
jgi:hypothetical protein